MKLCLRVAGAGAIFLLNTLAGSVRVQPFAVYDIGDALLQRCHHAYMEHITPVREKTLFQLTIVLAVIFLAVSAWGVRASLG